MNVKEAIRRTRSLAGVGGERFNLLAGSITSSSGELTLQHPTDGLDQGAVVELRTDDGGEPMHVWTNDLDNKQLTVERGWAGSTPLSASAGALVAIRPLVTDWEAYQVLQDVLSSLPGEGLYRQASTALTFDEVEDGYDVSALTDLRSIFAVELAINSKQYWQYEWRRDDDLLRLTQIDATTYPATLHYRAEFTPLASFTDDLEDDAGMPEGSADVLPLGAALRLVSGHEAMRGNPFAQQSSRQPEDVPPTSGLRVHAGLEAEYRRRLGTEIRLQRQRWPLRMAIP